MIFFLLIILAIVFLNLKTAKPGAYFEDYCSHDNTKSINAIFTLLIFLSHAMGYLDLGGTLDDPYLAVQSYMGQFVVATFLFYSGYGIMESITKKGPSYVRAIPFHRVFKVWYHFAIAILLYTAMAFFTGRELTLKNWLLAFTGWTAIGNSNWYVFAILMLYIFAFVAFFVFKKHRIPAVIFMFVLTLALTLFDVAFDQPDRYYNTIFLFPFGMVFSMIKPYLDRLLKRSDLLWYLAFTGVFAVYYYFSSNREDSVVHHTLWCLFGVALVLLFTMKVQIKNSILLWIGDHVFSIYILMRLPMLFLDHFGFNDHKYSFIVISFIATILLAVVFDAAMAQLDRLIYKRPKKSTASPTKAAQ